MSVFDTHPTNIDPYTGRPIPYAATSKFAKDGSPLPMSRDELATLERLHRDSGTMGHTTAGMAICQTCSHGPGIGDEATAHKAYWPCATARLLATIRRAQGLIDVAEERRQRHIAAGDAVGDRIDAAVRAIVATP